MMEKRSDKRIPTQLVATIKQNNKKKSVEVRDYSQGGMFLSFINNLKLIDIHGSLALEAGMLCTIDIDQANSFGQSREGIAVEVIRADQYGAGVKFKSSDAADLIKKLFDKKSHSAETQPIPASPTSKELTLAERNSIIKVCNQLSETCFKTEFPAYFRAIHEKLFDSAGLSKSIDVQNELFDAQTILFTRRECFPQKYCEKLQKLWLDSPQDIRELSKSQQEKNNKLTLTLSLVEHNTLDNWLAFQDMGNKAEIANQLAINELNTRLSLIFDTHLSKENNPYAPALFAYAFQACLDELEVPSKPLQICYSLFKEHLNSAYTELVNQLNNLLIEKGILPDIKDGYVIKNHASSYSGAVVRKDDETNAESVDIALPSTAIDKLKGLKTEQWMKLLRNLEGAHSQVGAPISDHSQEVSFSEFSSSANSAMANIGSNLADTATEAPATAAGEVYEELSRGELYDALTSVQSSQFDNSISDKNFMPHVIGKIKESISSHGKKLIPDAEVKILDVTSQLYDTLSFDEMVADSVKPWLRQLAVPIMKVALQDESFFVDMQHPARQLINNIAKLEFYGEDPNSPALNGVRGRVNQLLNNLEQQTVPSPSSIELTLKVVSGLVKIQNKAYQQNITDVIAECVEMSNSLDPIKTVNSVNYGDPVFLQWMKRVRRLKVGDWVIFDDGQDKSRPLYLAWISPESDFFAFVNKKGQKEKVITVEDLAYGFRSNQMYVPQNVDDPAVDRAQFLMLEALHKKVIHDSAHDPLSGLPNRREMERRLADKIATGEPATVCIMVFDQLEAIRNAYGEEAASKLLLDLASLLKVTYEKDIICGRVSENSFGLIYPFALDEAQKCLSLLREIVKGFRFVWEEKSLGISMYTGIVESSAVDNSSQIMKNAASAASLARIKGANSSHTYQKNDSELIKQRQYLEWASKIDQILQHNMLTLRCQYIYPVKNSESRKPSIEILLGMVDESGHLVISEGFVAAAEHYNRMAEVDRWIISNTFKTVAENIHRLEDVESISINLSASSLDNERFADFIISQAGKSGVPMKMICFDITKTAEIHNLSNASDFIHKIKATGCKFALDDFGSGNSSYAYLKNLPVDYLKIDGSFIREMDSNVSDYAVVKSIVEMGHFMGKEVIAESVENESILTMLVELDVDYSQGYINGQPMLFDEVLGSLTTH